MVTHLKAVHYNNMLLKQLKESCKPRNNIFVLAGTTVKETRVCRVILRCS